MVRRSAVALLAVAMLASCGSGSEGATAEVRGAGQAGAGAATVDDVAATDGADDSTTDESAATTAPTSVAPASTPPPSTAPAPTTVPPTTAPPTTTPPTTAPPSTAPPVRPPQLARCVSAEINLFTTGRRGEIALYQQTLRDLGYDPGEIDGFFGPNTYAAASQEVLDNGNVAGPNGVFEELFPDDGAVLPAAFERLGIGCIDEFTADF